jgi:LPS export ABC transporter protein LptC
MKKTLFRYSPLAVIVFLFLVIGFYLIKAPKKFTDDRLWVETVSGDGIKMTNIHYIQNNPHEGVKWVLDAKEGASSKDMGHISFKTFQLKLEPQNGSSMELKGQGGEYDKRSNEINLRGDLYGMINGEYKIFTDHLIIRQKEGDLRTEEPVRIIGPFFSIEGKGLFLSFEEETLRIHSNVTTRINRTALVL